LNVSILIVNYNTSQYTERCIESIVKYENTSDIEIIIIDNNSTDDSKEIINSLTHKYNFVKAVFLDSNKGFAFGNNRGFDISSGDYILILNPDTCFREPLFERLREGLTNNISAIAPKLYGEDGKYQFEYYQRFPSIRQYLFFYSIYAKFFKNRKRFIDKYLRDSNAVSNYKYPSITQLPGAFVFLKRDTFETVKLFNEKYFLFFEDVELSYKLSKLGNLALASELGVIHTGASSMEQKTNDVLYGIFIISMLKFFKYNYSCSKYIILLLLCLTNTLIKLIFNFFLSPFKKDLIGTSTAHKYILRNLLRI